MKFVHFINVYTFTFMHLADAFIQSDLHCIQVTVLHLSALAFPGNRTHDLGVASAMLYHLSYRKAYPFYIYTYPNPKPTPYNNEKVVIIVVQCDKNYAVLMCACPVAPYISLLALTPCHTSRTCFVFPSPCALCDLVFPHV